MIRASDHMESRASHLKIRPLKSNELVSLRRLWAESGLPFKPKGRDSMENLRRQRLRDPRLFVGAFDGNKMVGAVLASDDGRKGWINRLAVVPDARGKGAATQLIRHCEGIFRKRGRRLFCVHIEAYNTESIALFEREGYAKEEEIFYFTKREREDY